MSDPVQLANAAREQLATALSALQSDVNAPTELVEAAEPIAQAMTVLHRIVRSNGTNLEGRDYALDAVRSALDRVQQVTTNHAAVDVAMEAIAGSLSKVHALARLPAAPPPAHPAAPTASPTTHGPSQLANVQHAVSSQAMGATPAYVHPSAIQPAQASPSIPQPTYPQQLAHAAAATPQVAPFPMPTPAATAGSRQVPAAYTGWTSEALGIVPGLQRDVQDIRTSEPSGPDLARRDSAPTSPQSGATGSRAMHGVPSSADTQAPGKFLRQENGTVPEVPTGGRVRADAAWAPHGAGPAVDVELGTHSASNFYKGLGGNDVIEHGGVFVATYRVPKIGAVVSLRVLLPGDYEFRAVGTVQWTRDPGSAEPGFGARFTEIGPEGRQLVYRYTRNREPMFYDDL